MFLVGLTGGIASGKSSVLQVFQQLGCAVIDVDVIARHGEWRGQVVGLYMAAPLCSLFISPSKASELGKTSLLTLSDVLLPASCLSSRFSRYSSISLEVSPPSLHPHDQLEGLCALCSLPSPHFIFASIERSNPGSPHHFASSY